MDEQEEEQEQEEEEDRRSLGTIAVDISARHTCWGTFASIHAGGGKQMRATEGLLAQAVGGWIKRPQQSEGGSCVKT